MNHARVGYTSTLLPSGEVLVAGGYSRVLGPCAWVVSATGVSWSTAVSQARRCGASLTPSALAQSQPKREPRTADSCTGRDECDHTGV